MGVNFIQGPRAPFFYYDDYFDFASYADDQALLYVTLLDMTAGLANN